MKLAFLTMVWQDHWLLEKWVTHNSAIVPRSHLYVINHGADPDVARIAQGCCIIDVPREDVTPDLTVRRWALKSGLANGLLGFFDRVIVTDVDELLLYTGAHPEGLRGHLAQASLKGAATGAVGVNLIPASEGGTDPARPVLEQHPSGLLSGKYSKPCIVHAPVHYTTGGHGIFGGGFPVDPEVLLIHLHYVTPDYEERMAARRELVEEAQAQDADMQAKMPAGYWNNWLKSERIKNREFRNFAKAEPLDVSAGFGEVAAMLEASLVRRKGATYVNQNPFRDAPRRIELPQRLRGLI